MITPLTKHDNCEVEIVSASKDSKHYASLRCVDCNKWIQWLSKEDTWRIKGWDQFYYIPGTEPKLNQ